MLRDRPKLVVSDLDGCIVPFRGEEYDLTAVSKIREHSRERLSPEITIATGRSSAFVESVNYMLELTNTMICESGLVAYYPKNNMSEITLSNYQKALMKDVRKITESWLDCNKHVNMDRSKMIMITLFNRSLWESVEKFEKSILDYIDSEIGLNELDVVRSNQALDIVPKEVNKGSALNWLCYEKCINNKEVAVIGDGLNDLPMVEVSGYSCAPANVSEEIKDKFDYVSKYKYCAGVVDIVQHLMGV